VANLDTWLLVVTVAGMAVGGCGILMVQTARASDRLSWGHGLFVTALLALGVSSLLAALTRADGLVLLGLAAGLLVVGMLWETGQSTWRASDPDSYPEKT